MVNAGSSVNIIYSKAFEKMNVNLDLLKPCSVPLIDFTGHRALVDRKITLVMMIIYDKKCQTTIPIKFLVVAGVNDFMKNQD